MRHRAIIALSLAALTICACGGTSHRPTREWRIYAKAVSISSPQHWYLLLMYCPPLGKKPRVYCSTRTVEVSSLRWHSVFNGDIWEMST